MNVLDVALLAGAYVIVFGACGSIALLYRRSKSRLSEAVLASEERCNELRSELRAQRVALEMLRSHVAEAEQQLKAAAAAPASSWSNINRRTQVLRMLRTGRSAGSIASELKMTRGEVDLIEKVQFIVAGAYAGGSAENVSGEDASTYYELA